MDRPALVFLYFLDCPIIPSPRFTFSFFIPSFYLFTLYLIFPLFLSLLSLSLFSSAGNPAQPAQVSTRMGSPIYF